MIQIRQHLSLYFWFCLSNMLSIIIPVLTDRQHLTSNPGRTFNRPIIQTYITEIGQMSCLFVFFSCKKSKDYAQKVKPPFYIILTLMFLDMSCTGCGLSSLNYLSGSTYSILGSSLIISIAFFSKILLNRHFRNSQLLGCFITLIGVIVTGYAQKIDESAHIDQVIGFALAFLGFILQGLEMVFIERIYLNYSIDPTQLVGRWGTLGTIFFSISIFIFSNTKCPFSDNLCIEDFNGGFHLEYLPSFFQELRQNYLLVIFIIIFVITCALFNYFLTTVIMVQSALVYMILVIFNNFFVWIVGIAITLIGNGNDEFTIQSLNIWVILVKIIGFVVTATGLLLYNEIICNTQLDLQQKQQKFTDL